MQIFPSTRFVKLAKKLPKQIQQQVTKKCLLLAEHDFTIPHPQSVPYAGKPNHFRLRVGEYRIVYELEPPHIVLRTVYKRDDVYRKS